MSWIYHPTIIGLKLKVKPNDQEIKSYQGATGYGASLCIARNAP